MGQGKVGRVRPNFSLPSSLWESLQSDFLSFLDKLVEERGDFASSYQRRSWLEKLNSSDSSTAESRKLAAVQKWLRAEDRNAKTNHRLFWDSREIAGVDTDAVIETAARYIRRLIGPLSEVEWNIYSTSGASTRVKRSEVAAYTKFEGKAHVTNRALPWWLDAIEDTLLEDEEGLVYPEIVEGSVMFTVPKNAEIDRVACKEPEINQWLQRSIGVHLRQKLRKVGIDLLDQSKNRALAREGSVSGELATIDLSSASDLISRTLVNRLLPVEWYCCLDDLRVQMCILPDGTRHELHMFSSMGNGFTFELETLIFWAICSSIQHHFHTRGLVSVYGDDIVVTPRTARLFRVFAAWFGFKVNTKKSFSRGKFRESCGGHYHGGLDVTPFYTRAPIKILPELIHFLNSFRKWYTRVYPYGWGEGYLFWEHWSTKVPGSYHGGKDLEGISALVTVDKPRNRIVRSHGHAVRPERGSYLYWLTTKEATPDADVHVDPSKQSDWVVRRNREWNVSIPLFSEEYYF